MRDTNDLAGLRTGLYVRVSKMATRVGLVTTAGVQEKSTGDQAAVGREWAARAGAAVADTYSDPDISASRFTKKNRPQFDRMIADVQAGKLDLIWFWELSRSQRGSTCSPACGTCAARKACCGSSATGCTTRRRMRT